MPQRILPLSALAVAAALGCAGAWALGFGPLRAVATMGQPLDASVVVRLQPGETLADNCVSAVVTSGDNLLPAGQVTATFVQTPGSEPRVRVRTSTRIEEPFINLLVTIGCESRVARQFTVFADPPPVALALDSNSALPALAGASSPLPGQPEAEKAPSVMAGGAAPPPRTQGRRSEGQIQRPARERGQTVIAVNRSRAAAVTVEPALPVPRADRDDSSNRVASGVIVRPEGVARLRLDSAVVMPQNDNPLLRASQQREEALQTAKIAVDVAEAANSSAAQKIAAMEEQLAAARKEVIEAKAALQRVQAQQAASSMAAASAAAAATTTAAALGSDDWLSGYSTWLAAEH